MASTIPVIDLAAPTPRVVSELRHALEEVGFLQVVNHAVDLNMVDRTYGARDALFGLSEAVKESLRSETHPFRGWKRVRDSAGSRIQERFQVCNFDDAAAAAAAGVDARWLDYFHPNIWPSVPLFRDDVRAWFDATRALGSRLMSLFALALDLPADYFVDAFARDVTCFAMNVYPASVVSPSLDEPRVVLPAHADSGTLTILHQRGDYAGLQVQSSTGEWLRVPVLDDAFVINVGELMVRWTNDRWIGTRHRVIAPLEPGMARTSLTTFYLPSVDAVIAPLGDAPSRYEPVTPYAWEAAYLARQYAKVGSKYVSVAAAA